MPELASKVGSLGVASPDKINPAPQPGRCDTGKVDASVQTVRLEEPTPVPGTSRLLSYRLPIGHGAIEFKVRIERVTRPVTTQP